MSWEDACEAANTRFAELPPVKAAADALRIRPIVVVVIGVVLIASFFLYGFGGHFLCTVAGLFYPGFESFKALEAKDDSEAQFWLTYWIVYGAFTLAESFYYWIFMWMPFYFPLKLSFIIWLCLPTTRGAQLMYDWVVQPMLRKNRDVIEATLDRGTKELKRGLSGCVSVGFDGAGALHKKVSSELLTGATSLLLKRSFSDGILRRRPDSMECEEAAPLPSPKTPPAADGAWSDSAPSEPEPQMEPMPPAEY